MRRVLSKPEYNYCVTRHKLLAIVPTLSICTVRHPLNRPCLSYLVKELQ